MHLEIVLIYFSLNSNKKLRRHDSYRDYSESHESYKRKPERKSDNRAHQQLQLRFHFSVSFPGEIAKNVTMGNISKFG